jgi:hypothetical protein
VPVWWEFDVVFGFCWSKVGRCACTCMFLGDELPCSYLGMYSFTLKPTHGWRLDYLYMYLSHASRASCTFRACPSVVSAMSEDYSTVRRHVSTVMIPSCHVSRPLPTYCVRVQGAAVPSGFHSMCQVLVTLQAESVSRGRIFFLDNTVCCRCCRDDSCVGCFGR